MIKEVFRNNRKNFNPKEMYSKLVLLTNTSKMTDFLNPGVSFVITNQ